MITAELRDRIRHQLERDRIWSAYALADLDPTEDHHCEWLVRDSGVVLIYQGLQPAALIAHGDPEDVRGLLPRIPSSHYVFLLMGIHRVLLTDQLQVEVEQKMWRMALKPEDFPGTSGDDVNPITIADLEAITNLFGEHRDQPDAFHPDQMRVGPFYGIWDQGNLVSMAGIHVLSRWANVAALGNVFTHPDYRGRGMATRCSAYVVQDLLDAGIETVVLNVAMDNEAALRCYQGIGFWPFCGYYEGIGNLTQV